MFVGWRDGHHPFVAATTGSIADDTIEVKKIFWNEHVYEGFKKPVKSNEKGEPR